MDYEQIKRLMEDMGNSKLTSLDIEFPDGIKIKMEKENERQVVVTHNIEESAKNPNDIKEEKKENGEELKQDGFIVTSPMVGTFYQKSSPESSPYVEKGSIVKKGDILCIIEAMKLMNEIESEYDGEVVDIFVKDGEPVEYGKPLFKIK